MTTLTVTPDYLERLAAFQDHASEDAASAARVARGIGHAVWVTHGLISGDSNRALISAEVARRRAVEAIQASAVELADWLRHSADAYRETDHDAAWQLNRS